MGKLKRTHYRNSNRALYKDVEAVHPEFVNALSGSVNNVLRQLVEIDPTTPSQIPLEGIRRDARGGYEHAWRLSDVLRETEKERSPSQTPTASRSLDSARHYLYELQKALSILDGLTERSGSLLANTPAMLLIGNAGVGKTHLFCDTAVERQLRNQCSLVMLGEQFSRDAPWTQIIKFLGLTCNLEHFLGALNAAGQARQNRTLIFVDALTG